MRHFQKHLHSLFFIPLCLLLFARTAKGQDYVGYYQAIAGAEEAAVHGRYADALLQYEKTFAAYPYNNPLDCYVAAQLAACTLDTATCMDLLRKGLCFGLPEICIRRNLHLQAYSLNMTTLDSCMVVYQSRINPGARTKMISLFQYDQSIVLDPKAKDLYRPGTLVLREEYQPIWDSLVAEIIQLTQQYGFPAQKIIGTQQGDDSLLKPSPHSAFAYFVLIHYRQAWPKMHNMLRSELSKGNITPQMYATLADHSNRHADEHRMQYFALRPCSSKNCKTTVHQRLGEINAARQIIGLCSYEVMGLKHLSTLRYLKVSQEKGTDSTAIDFQPDLHFMGK